MKIPLLRCACLSLVVLLLRPSVLPGQMPQLEVGERVRVVAPPFTDGRLVGTVLATNPQGLVLATRSTPDQVPTVEIPLEAIESLEISLGQRSNTLNGLAYGALGGAVLGAAVVAVSCLAEGCSGDGASAGGWIAFGAIVGAGGGAVLGLLVGSLVKTETWEDSQTRIELDPAAQR